MHKRQTMHTHIDREESPDDSIQRRRGCYNFRTLQSVLKVLDAPIRKQILGVVNSSKVATILYMHAV